MKNPEIKNGQLWFNTKSQRVERVIHTNAGMITTSFHKEMLYGWPRTAFRRATSEEVKVYLAPIVASPA